MKCGFDLDGTLDQPKIAELARILFEAGHEVHVITVAQLGMAGYFTTREEKIKKLERLRVPYTSLHLVGGHTYTDCGRQKAQVVDVEGIEVYWDDSHTFCDEVAKGSDAVVFRVEYED